MNAAVAEPLLRRSVAFVWLATGLLVFHPYYRAVGAEHLAPLGLGSGWMVLACALEVTLAVMVAIRPMPGWLVGAQIATVAGFTVVLATVNPMLLVHPLGVLTKNIPLMAVLVTAWLVGRDGWSARAVALLRAGIAAIWITEGIFPKLFFQDAMEVGVVQLVFPSEELARIAIRCVGVAQALSGAAILLLEGRVLAWVLRLQLAALVFLPLLVTAALPLMWAHPFGPLTKNIPIVIGTYVLLRKCSSTS